MPRYIDKDKLINSLKEDYATLVKERWFEELEEKINHVSSNL